MSALLGSERPRPGRSRRVVPFLVACVAAAVVAAIALDADRVERERFIPPPADPSMMKPPEFGIWSAAPLAAGSPPPAFRLRDARTGAQVGLDDYRGRPVVLLFGSFG